MGSGRVGQAAKQTPVLLADVAVRAAASLAEATSMSSGAPPAGHGVGPFVSTRCLVLSLFCMVWSRSLK